MSETVVATKHPMEPPGGIVIWFFVGMELLVFGVAFLVFFDMRGQEREIFATAQKQLNPTLGLINTLILITSGYFVALANHAYKKQKHRASTWFLLAMFLGIGFLGVKAIEYSSKIATGSITNVNAFFDFYWLLTVFHAAHIFLGLFLLLYISIKIRRQSSFDPEGFTVATGSVYWHLCDLIWVLLFPVLYLL